jgi:hypothetical protein
MKEEMAAIEKAVAQSKQLESGERKTAMKSAELEPKIDSVITELKAQR